MILSGLSSTPRSGPGCSGPFAYFWKPSLTWGNVDDGCDILTCHFAPFSVLARNIRGTQGVISWAATDPLLNQVARGETVLKTV